MIAKLLVLAAIASAFVPTAPRATSLTKRFFFDQFIPNPEADAELDGYVGSAKAVLRGAYIKLSWRCGLLMMIDSRAGPAHGRRRRWRGRQDRARRREALHVHGGQPRREAQQGEAARVTQAPRRRRHARADRRGPGLRQEAHRVPLQAGHDASGVSRCGHERRGAPALPGPEILPLEDDPMNQSHPLVSCQNYRGRSGSTSSPSSRFGGFAFL